MAGEWSRAQRRCWHRIRSLLHYWQARGYQLLWVMLSTAPGGDRRKLRYHHKRLLQQLDRKLGFGGVEHFLVETTEGNGVLHVVWAWRGSRSFYVPQAWLSAEWERLHGAPVVWVSRIGNGRRDRDRLSRYMVAQYCGSQSGFVRFSYSWWRCELALAKCWEALKKQARARSDVSTWCGRNPGLVTVTFVDLLSAWEALLREGAALLGDAFFIIRRRELVEAF